MILAGVFPDTDSKHTIFMHPQGETRISAPIRCLYKLIVRAEDLTQCEVVVWQVGNGVGVFRRGEIGHVLLEGYEYLINKILGGLKLALFNVHGAKSMGNGERTHREDGDPILRQGSEKSVMCTKLLPGKGTWACEPTAVSHLASRHHFNLHANGSRSNAIGGPFSFVGFTGSGNDM